MKQKLEQTKGIFKFRGLVKGINNENALREDVTKKDKPYKSLSFFVETSPNNAVKVEIFAMERDTVVFWNSQEKDKKKARLDVAWEDRHESHAPFGLMGMRLGLEQEKGKNKQVNLVEWDAIDYIMEHLKEGDSVYISGNNSYSVYKDQQGNEHSQVQYQIGQISKTKDPIDFDDEKFVEMSSFEQDIVVTSTEVADGKLYVNAKTIDYRGNHVDAQFVIDPEVEDGKFKKLANNMKKRLKYGDAIKVFGLVLNKSVKKAVETEEEDDWGGEKPAGMDVVTEYIREMRITAVDSSTYEPKKYTEDDFFNEDEDNFGDDSPIGDDFGDDDEDTGIDEDDDLPFA